MNTPTPTPRTDAATYQLLAEAERADALFQRSCEVEHELREELANERARLDWVFRNCKVFANNYTIHDREDLGVAMKEET